MDSYEAYKKNCDNLIVRDYLAMDRTKLANERTFLAYLRTFVAIFGAGIALIKLATPGFLVVLGYIMSCASPLFLIAGIYKYVKVIKKLKPLTEPKKQTEEEEE